MKRNGFFIVAGVIGIALYAGPLSAGALVLATSSRAGNPDLFLIDAETGDAFNLTRDAAFNAYPAWSRDGKKIAFATAGGGGMHICMIDPDGSNLKQLTSEQAVDRVPAFSPDGKKIAFSRLMQNEPTATTNVHVMDADGSNVALIQENAFDPAWSPDGKKIAFVSPRAGDGFRLYTMDADGKNVTELTTTGNNIGFAYPAWSPDSERIAFGDLVDNQIEIHVIDSDGKNVKQLTMFRGLNVYPAWSPDGKKLLFQHHEANRTPGPVYVMDVDGSNPTILSVLRSERFVEGGRHVWQPE
jgi:TolB protein